MTYEKHLDDIQMLSQILDNYDLRSISTELRNNIHTDFKRIVSLAETEARIRDDYETLETMEMSGLIYNIYA